MDNKKVKKIITLGAVGTMIVSSFINVYAEGDIANDDYLSEDIISQDMLENKLKMEVLVENEFEIDLDNAKIKFKTLNCNNIQVKDSEGNVIIGKKIESNRNEWIESYLDIPVESLHYEIVVEFKNEETGEITVSKINIPEVEETKKIVLETKNVTPETEYIYGEYSEKIDEVYALIGEKKIIADLEKSKNKFKIEIKGQKIGDEIEIYAKKENTDDFIIDKIIVECTIEKNNNIDVEKEIQKETEIKESIKESDGNKKLDLTSVELNDLSNKLKGVTYPNSLVKIEINGFTMKSYADDEGQFEVELYYKRKANTKVKIILSHKDFEKNKTIITYVEDKKPPKSPYIKGSIKEGDNSIHGKSEIGSKILVKVYEPTHKVIDKVISVRHTPTKKAINKIGRLIKGANVVVLEKIDGWSKIQFKQSIGYVKNEELMEIASNKINHFEGYADKKGNFNISIDKQNQGATIKIMAEDDNENKSGYTITTVEKNT